MMDDGTETGPEALNFFFFLAIMANFHGEGEGPCLMNHELFKFR